MADIASDVTNVRVSVARIEQQLTGLSRLLEELREHDERLAELENATRWVKAWGTGVAAAMTVVFSVVTWVVASVKP